jgi:hypothetical protein
MTQSELNTSDATLLQDFLRERDVPCPRCGYNLRNLVGQRCPECGDELVLRVNLSEPKMGAFLTGLVGLASGAGFSGLLALYGLIMITIHDRSMRGFFSSFMIVTAGGLLVLGLGLAIWIRSRSYIRRQPSSRQWWLAVGCWCLVLADLIIFTKSIR